MLNELKGLTQILGVSALLAAGAAGGAAAAEDQFAGLSQSAAASFCAKLEAGEAASCEKAVLSGAGDAAAEAAAWSFASENAVTRAVDRKMSFRTTVYRAWRNEAGDMRVALTNGDVWAQRGDKEHKLPQPGDAVSFKPDLYGNYSMNFKDSRDAIKVAPLSVSKQ
jgi:hypothetical protein